MMKFSMFSLVSVVAAYGEKCGNSDCCKALTAISTDSSVIYHIDLVATHQAHLSTLKNTTKNDNLKSKKQDDDDDDDATGEALEVTTDVDVAAEPGCPGDVTDCSAFMSGRIGLNSRFALQATTDEPASVDSSEVRFSAKASWVGSDPLAVCEQHEAYVVSHKGYSFRPAVYRVEVPTVPTTEVDENDLIQLIKGVNLPQTS